MIQKKPIFVDFDRRRELTFNLNTEILIRGAVEPGASLWQTIGVEKDAETGEEKRTLDVSLDNLRAYLWAALQEDAKAHGEMLTIEDVGSMITRRKWVTQAVMQLTAALSAYYGDEPGEAAALPVK
jgi:hypothetical protein